jgi:hypothetical protein
MAPADCRRAWIATPQRSSPERSRPLAAERASRATLDGKNGVAYWLRTAIAPIFLKNRKGRLPEGEAAQSAGNVSNRAFA